MPDAQPTADLDAVPEDWSRALAVVAHPDDLEYGVASAIARWTDQGKQISYLLVTSGEAGIDSLPPDECARIRQEEERRSAAVVGVDTVEFLAHPDGLVEPTVELRRDLAVAIRRHRPEVVVSINFRETFGFPGFNHADHRNTGLALLDAVRDAGNRWLFVGAGGEPWNGVRFALFGSSPASAHAVDVRPRSTGASPRWRSTAPTLTPSTPGPEAPSPTRSSAALQPRSGPASAWRQPWPSS